MKDLAQAEGDVAVLAEVAVAVDALAASADEFERELRFCGPHDRRGAYLELTAGAGGLEAQDFARLLLVMYERFAARRGFSARRISERQNAHGGIKQAVLEIRGQFAYG